MMDTNAESSTSSGVATGSALTMHASSHRVGGMKTPTLKAARQAMREMNLTHTEGYVIFFAGRHCGWSIQPEPKAWLPGCVAVDLQTGAQFEGVGGTYQGGLERWIQLSHAS